MAKAAAARVADGAGDRAFYDTKLTTARYFFERFGPDAGALRRKIEGGSESLMALDEDAFLTAA
jgi:hypothetical protein